jgi:hypothetical protein
MMNCQEIRELFAEEWAGTLDNDSRANLKSHLLECALCREERESLNRLWAGLGKVPNEEPGPALRPQFYSMLRSYQQDRDRVGVGALPLSGLSGQFGRAFLIQPIFQFGLAAMLLLVGFFGGYILKSSRSGQEELSNLREEVREMRQMVTISLLKQQSASERLKGVSWSSQVSRPDSKFLSILMNTLNHDHNVDVRLAAVDALSRFASHPQVRTGLIESLAKQDSPLVQISLIDLLVQIRERKSIDVLRKIVDDAGQNQQVRQRAEWGLQKLT